MNFLLFTMHYVSTSNIAVALTVFLLFYYWYHRPRNFPPGPRGLPLVGVAPFVGRYFEKAVKRWSKTYGPVMTVRIGRQDFVVLNDYDSIYKAFVKQKDHISGRVQMGKQDVFQDEGYGILSVDYGPFWKSQRKFGLATLRGFGVGKRSMEERVAEEVAYLNKEIQNYNGKAFDLLVKQYSLMSAAKLFG